MPRPTFLVAHAIPVWVVITGNVRSGREFRQIFKQALELRESGEVDGIRFVTWKGELEQAPGLEMVLVNAGVSILIVDPPSPAPKIHPLFHGYVYHQRKALHFGLQTLPSDCFVLKARTDFAAERFESMVKTLFGDPGFTLGVDIQSPIFRTRLFSYDVRPDYLFYWDDIVFSGMRDDLVQLNNFDVSCDFVQPGHISPPESRLYGPIFLKHYPILRWFSENIRGEEFASLLRKWTSSNASERLPILIIVILASYFHVISRYVALPKSDSLSGLPISLKSFFTSDPELGVIEFPKPWVSHKLINQCLSDRLRGREDFDDTNLAAIVDAMRQMDSVPDTRGALPPNLEQAQLELEEFSIRLGCRPLITQTQLISEQPTSLKKSESTLEDVKLPEKRHLSWWQQKKLGARRHAAEWLLRKIV